MTGGTATGARRSAIVWETAGRSGRPHPPSGLLHVLGGGGCRQAVPSRWRTRHVGVPVGGDRRQTGRLGPEEIERAAARARRAAVAGGLTFRWRPPSTGSPKRIVCSEGTGADQHVLAVEPQMSGKGGPMAIRSRRGGLSGPSVSSAAPRLGLRSTGQRIGASQGWPRRGGRVHGMPWTRTSPCSRRLASRVIPGQTRTPGRMRPTTEP
jgi:hypothetical protein